ncbi:protein MOR1-like [Humulus lupulus]|uniref:protein MOR1-like n=1 Tax=Humulus lupulus TaxID=3486 RepID=UPI002B412029|nr:protein MOR1-like [Humulus lupulus]
MVIFKVRLLGTWVSCLYFVLVIYTNNNNFFPESFETAKTISAPASKTLSKVGKSTSNGVLKHGRKVASSRTVGTKALRSESIMSVQDIVVQSQALLNVKDSNKVQLKQAIFECFLLLNILTSNHLDFTYLQEDRERLVVRRFKFEDPRIEQIQDLEVVDIVVSQICLFCI